MWVKPLEDGDKLHPYIGFRSTVPSRLIAHCSFLQYPPSRCNIGEE